jgi:hypothetical protein
VLERQVDAVLDLRGLRAPAALMVAASAVLPLVPGHPGLVCPLRALTGVPCPLCGMTTSVEDTIRLDLGGAAAANPAGLALVAAALAILVGRPRSVAVPTGVPIMLLLGMWLFELHRFGVV